jgi:uncharacterized SAM-binding protein YcdF (DUF218 family)
VFVILSKLLDFFLLPLSWALALLLAGLVLVARRSPRRGLTLGLLGGGLALLYVFSIAPVATALTAYGEGLPAPEALRTAPFDALVVLGGLLDIEATEDTGQRTFSDGVERLIATLRLAREERARFVLVSGGNVRGSGTPEAVFLADQLEEWGLPRSRIVIEDVSRNTHENAVESARIARERGWRSLLLVTSAAHMPRALGCFRAEGLAVTPYATDFHATRQHLELSAFLPRAEHLGRSSAVLRELAGRVVYRLRGWTHG